MGGRNWDRAKADKVRFKEAGEYIQRDWGPGKVGSVSSGGQSMNPTPTKRTEAGKRVTSVVVARPTKAQNPRLQPPPKLSPPPSAKALPSPATSIVQISTLAVRHKHLDRLVSDLAVATRQRNILLVKSIAAEMYLLASM